MSDLKTARPLSPHLSIYRFRPTMAMSILHRITGSALYVGTLLFVWWLVAAASGPEAFSYASAFFGSIIGRLILFGYTWALLHHMFGGIRHLVWDTGIGLGKETSTMLAQATLVASLVFTLVLWIGLVVFG
ncbi:succinate dehydrogenase, cytochrome b556 subunit [Aurantimonas sp. A2-1-M11]|uniref:succinate dehydrogenase, cytochrome b556 subunit n=1 Tax=Aurantimonas sp. A2-1-M11 TaxID=3113712 RepID=UPI002F94FD01